MSFSNRGQRFGFMGKILAVSVLLFSALILTASAQIPKDYGIKETASAAGLPTGQTSVSAVTAGIINTLLGIVGALAVVLIIYAGFLWMTSQGNEEKISTAKKLIAGSVIGLFIIFAAYTIALFVVNQIAKSTGGTSPSATYPTAGYDIPASGSCGSYLSTSCVRTEVCAGITYPANDCGAGETCCANSDIKSCSSHTSGSCYDVRGSCPAGYRDYGATVDCSVSFKCCAL